MKKIFFFAMLLMTALATSTVFTSCSDDDDNKTETTIDATQQRIITNYVNNVVIPTYRSLADASIALADACEELQTQEQVNKACDAWIEARRYWELSEAWLFGAAADYNIDPHIDSWPLDLTQLDVVLRAGDIEARIDAGTAGYGLLGFHAVEYAIFMDGAQGDYSNRRRNIDDISDADRTFAKAVADDMRNQCVLLEAAWAGTENITAAKRAILEEKELSPSRNYGTLLIEAGLQGNSQYRTQAAAFEEILVGASDIADEVGNTKISDPMKSHNWSDVESPHSWNSVADFVDNIRSVRNAYLGTLDGTRSSLSVSAHINSLNATVDANVIAAINNALEVVDAMPRPFRNYISEDTSADDKAKINAAVDACNSLVEALDAAVEILH